MPGKLLFSGAVIQEVKKMAYCKLTMQTHSNMRRLIYDRLWRADYTAYKNSRPVQNPVEYINRVARHFDLVYMAIYLDPPNWVWVKGRSRVRKYDEFGRLLYMGPRVMPKKVLSSEFAPLPQFEQVFPQHTDPTNATDEEKRDRLLVYLEMYANTGLVGPSAKAVGVSYMQLIVWMNERAEYQTMAQLANEAAKQVMLDVGRMRALQGDSGLMRFFIESDNPELRRQGKGTRKVDELPEGITQQAVATAFSQVAKAQANALNFPKEEPDGVDGEYEGHEQIVIDKAGDILNLVNQTAESLVRPSLALPDWSEE